ncbi:MAG: hypothetical protein WEC59_05165 [Salibacteraceae bacterium]
MRKKEILILVLLIVPCTLLAQVFDEERSVSSNSKDPEDFEATNDAFVGFSAGVSLPLGQFKSADYQNYYSGYAEDGYYLNFINGHQKLTKHFGIGINWYRSAFGFDERSFIELYEEVFTDLDFNSSAEDPWILHSGTVSLVTNIPHRIIDVDFRLAIGVGRAIRPRIDVEGYEPSTGFISFLWTQEQSMATDLILGFGMNGRLHVTDIVDVLVQWDYQRMKSTFDINNVYAGRFIEPEELDQQFEILNFGLGLGVRIE